MGPGVVRRDVVLDAEGFTQCCSLKAEGIVARCFNASLRHVKNHMIRKNNGGVNLFKTIPTDFQKILVQIGQNLDQSLSSQMSPNVQSPQRGGTLFTHGVIIPSSQTQ